MKRWTVAAVAVAVLLAGASQAQRAPVKLKCTFDRWANPRAGTISEAKDFTLEFLIDRTLQTAYMVGNNGIAEVRMVTGSSGMTFLEVLVTGAVQSTTIDHGGGAVHSRHTMMGLKDEVFPSQYYGTCR